MARIFKRGLEFPEPPAFRARHQRPHMAQEYRESGRIELVNEMTRHLRPHFAMCARGEVSDRFSKRWAEATA